MHDPYFQNISLSDGQEFSLRCFHRMTTEDWKVNYHFHELCELVVYESISGQFFSNGDKYSIKRQQVLFIPPESIHGFEVNPGELIYHVTHFHPQLALKLQNTATLPNYAILADISEQDFELVLSLLKWIETHRGTNSDDNTLTIGFKLLLDIVSKAISTSNIREKRTPNHFAPVVTFLNQSNSFNLSVTDAADLCHMSRSHFLATFKRTYGITFNAFLEDRKISTAKHLLVNTEKSINQIADHVGVNSAAYFTKIFGNVVGCTPSQYRRHRVKAKQQLVSK